MKYRLTIWVLLGLFLVLGFLAGRAYQHAQTGYHYEVQKTQTYQFDYGEIESAHVTESVGLPFLDTGISVLTLTTEPGLPVVIYKAKSTFQEPDPFARDVTTDGNTIQWNDGINSYQLSIEPISPPEGNAEPGVQADDQ